MAPEVPPSAPDEDKEICRLINSGLDPSRLFKAAYSFYRYSLEEKLGNDGQVSVQSGLFKGLLLYQHSLASQLLPKWSGTYETEVQQIIERNAPAFNCFVNIGCAEGYYLTGISKIFNIPSHGVDIDYRSHIAVAEACNMNNLGGLIKMHNSVTEAIYASDTMPLVLIDVDGNEMAVLKELQESLSRSTNILSVRLVVESDKDETGRNNSDEIIRFLVLRGWSIHNVVMQSPIMRFRSLLSNMSFLEQVVRGTEGRPGGQCWIEATRQVNLSAQKTRFGTGNQ